MKIILASGSPRRKELMELAGFNVTVSPTNADENIEYDGNPAAFVAELSKIKGAAAKVNRDELVLSADTIVCIDNQILGKPEDENDAKRMLKMLSGKVHFVYTGVTIRYNEKIVTFTEKTEVEFFELTDEIIDYYVATNEPFDKAGGYGIQGKGCILVRKINGDYSNVVGLPIARVYREIEKLMGNA